MAVLGKLGIGEVVLVPWEEVGTVSILGRLTCHGKVDSKMDRDLSGKCNKHAAGKVRGGVRLYRAQGYRRGV